MLAFPCLSVAKTINLYYVEATQPKDFSDEKMKKIITNATDMWKKCNISFNFEKSDFLVYWDSNSSLDLKGFTDIKEQNGIIISYKIALNSLHKSQSIDFLSYILAHEIGHALGLKHNLDINSIMFFKTNDIVNKNLSEQDISECKHIE